MFISYPPVGWAKHFASALGVSLDNTHSSTKTSQDSSARHLELREETPLALANKTP